MTNNLKLNQIILFFSLLFVTFIIFFPAVDSKFADLDDSMMVIFNKPTQQGLTLKNITNIFSVSHEGLYHPMVTLSYTAERYFFGLTPELYHLNNVLLHLLNTFLVFLIFLRLSKSFAISYIVTVLFALHPAHVEAVAWISSRKDTLYSLFYLFSILFYLKSHDGQKSKLMIFLSLIFFMFSCFSKAMAVTLPFVLILIDYYKYGIKKENLKNYVLYFIISAFFAFIAVNIHYPEQYKVLVTAFSNAVNILNAHFNILFYIYKFFLPVNLYCIYPDFYNPFTMPPAYIMYAPAFLYMLILIVILSLKKTKFIFFGFMFFLITIFPVSGVMKVGYSAVADRYTYIPYLGLFYIFAKMSVFLYKKTNKFFKTALIFCAVLIFVLLAYLTYNRNWDWNKNTFGPPENMKYYNLFGDKK